MLTFLGGAHACIGYRFSVIELKSLTDLLVYCRMKALLFVLVRTFEFDLAVPAEDIVGKMALIQRPHVKSESAKGSQLPLWMKLYVPS
ncbi:hypothetical protein F5880DRAFT_1548618 [Lentinula raphanica]|nr:hypothetical protein F5880DRAFT_1548618 [Lentinula raphanica]